MTTDGVLPDGAVAIVGMAGRFPGAGSVLEFWDNLSAGTESIVDVSEQDLLAAGVSEQALANSAYVRRAALLDGIEEFDAEFFGFTPHAARMTDPQHRLFLQCAFHAVEDAGLDPAAVGGSVGVFATSTTSGYLLHNLMSVNDPHQIIGQGVTFEMVNLSLQNDKDYLATRVAHQFDFRGPALSVQTACSSALVAVHLACQSILNGECDMALAGGASLRIPHRVGYWYEPGSMVSASGHCRPFDVRSDGTVFGSGVGVVVLKSLSDAVEAGDRIHAVIRGSALNNDGSTKMTYAAPNAAGQADVIAEAHAVAGVDAATVSYVETHGTGTPLGDPIEIEGLRQAFSASEEQRSGPCFVGSVKSNIGHLESAAGIAGLIKTILCLKHRAIPATLHYTSPNPELHLDSGPFVVRAESGPWEADGARRAGVSSFGVGGTNAHVVLEEWPEPAVTVPEAGRQVLVLSARSRAALERARSELAAALSGAGAPALADAAATLAGRRKEGVRLAAVVGDRGDAAAVLAASEHDNVFVGESAPDAGGRDRVVFLFPGQGAQHAGMAHGLYQTEPVFAEHFDECAAGFAAELGVDLAAVIFDGTARELERTDRTQPALFAVQYALAKLVQSYGVQPAAMAGHSIGEYAAATIAGVFDLATAIKVVAMRARLMHAAPRGAMVAVALGPDAVSEYLGDDVDLATVNDPGGCVVAGSEEGIRGFSERLKAAGVSARRVRTSHAFHSRLMDSVIPEFTGFLSRVQLWEPTIPLLSNLTGTWLTGAEATNPATWARSVRATVRFSDELDAVLSEAGRVLVEVGPGGVLTGSAMRHPRWSDTHRAVRLMRHQVQNRDDRDAFLLGLGQLWAADVEVDWSPLRGGYQPRRVSLPGYPFERARHWVDYQPGVRVAAGAAAAAPATAAGAAGVAGNGGSPVETALQRIWAQCLGVGSVDRHANFFDLGGDSLVAISVAMTAGHEGLDLTPQDLYDNPTLAALAKTLTARYAAGGLARQSPGDVAHPPLPPNIVYFLEHGLRDAGQWRIPLIVRLAPQVTSADITAVLTAVINHHDVLRLRIGRHAGTWQQHIEEPIEEFTGLITAALPDSPEPADGTDQHRMVLDILTEQLGAQELSSPPVAAAYLPGRPDRPGYLALSVHAIVADDAAREILLTDLVTAFGQQLSGEPISLARVPTSWLEWSQRCAALTTHPAVIESRDYWLHTATTPTTLQLAGPAEQPPASSDLDRLATTLSTAKTTDLDDARRRLRTPINEILLAALARTLASTLGEGTIGVDLVDTARPVLKPDIDLHRTLGQITSVYPVTLDCSPLSGSATELFNTIGESLRAVPHHGIGYGLLRYLYAPTAAQLDTTKPSDIYFSYAGTLPDLAALSTADAPVQFDSDTAATPVAHTPPGLGHPVELRIYRHGGTLHLHWHYDTRRIDRTTIEALANQYTQTLIQLTQDALAEQETATETDDLALVDLTPNTST